MITFHQPLWIAAGFFCCLIVWLLWHHYERTRSDQLSRFAAESLMPALTANVSQTRRRIKKWLVLLSVLLCFIALARPQSGHRWINVKHKGIDILFALDTSKSMLAEDVRPNRLERSKLAVLDFVSNLSGDRVGLMPFAGTSYLMCPLTADYNAFEQSLMAVDHRTIPTGGTTIESAIDGALKIFAGTANHKILIIITDGEQQQSGVIDAATRAADNDMIIYTVGVGTESGELVPDPENGGFIQNEDGTYVKSRLDSSNLQRIAEATHGLYADLGDRGQGLDTIYRQKLTLVPQTELAEKRKQVPIERFGWPLALAVILLSLELIVSERKPERNGGITFLNRITGRFRKTFAVAFLCTMAAIPPVDLYSFEAEDAYAKGNFIEAGEHYRELLAKDPDNPLIIFNNGTTAYHSNLFEEAAEAFDRALTSDDLHLQEKSYFNRGNALYRIGEAALQAQPDQTIGNWERAVASYEGALALNPDNEQAAENHAFVREKIEQLKQQQSEQKNRQDNDDESPDTDENDNTGNADNEKDNEPGSDNQASPQKADHSPEHAENDEQQKQENQQQGDESASEQSEQSEQSNETRQPGADQDTSGAHTNTAAETANGQMSREEALQLLQAMTAEEGRIDFYAPLEKNPSPPSQDW